MEVSDSEYADDTAVLFPSRAELEKWAPVLIQTFADFGMEVHIKRPGDRKEKTIVLFVAVQGCEYDRYYASAGGAGTYGGTDLSDIKLPCGGLIPVKEEAKYLGSTLNRNADHAVDIAARIKKAGSAFGRLKPLIFKSKGISLGAKRAAYVTCVLSILLYGSEMWVLSARSRRQLRSFHRRCVRCICGVNMWHVKNQKITTKQIFEKAELSGIDTYLSRRRLRWLGHVSRMDWSRTPRKLLTAWCYQKRPASRPVLRWAESIETDIKFAKLNITKWHEEASDKEKWKEMTRCLGLPKERKRKQRRRQQ